LANGNKSNDPFEAALKREFQSARASDTADCPAPDVIAAYYDRSLSRSERTRVDTHLAACVRCQSMMAAIARADDSEGSLSPREPARGFFWITRLLAPLAVVGVVIAIVIGVRTREHQAPEVIALASPAVKSNDELEQRAAAPPPALEAPQAPPQASNAPGAVAADAMTRKKELTIRGLAAEEKMASPEASLSNSMVASDAAAPAQPAARTQSKAAFAMRAEGAGSAISGAVPLMAKAAHAIQVHSHDRSVAWQIGPSGTIMQSMNSGPWSAQRSGVTTDLLAGSAPSNDVCWIVGKSGTVLRTLDGGANWRAAHAPTPQDLTAVNASDSNNASAVAADGSSFTTRDGGVTWSAP
jgi:hypothetical protein